jgi:hypothetical protein
MTKSIHTRGVQSIHRMSTSGRGLVDADDLKLLVRTRLTSMTMADRKAFILELDRTLRSVNLSMRAYLIPLGISASSPEELTPGDVGHLIRFLKINVPNAIRVVDGVIEQFGNCAEKVAKSGDLRAA